ncbi:MAG: translation elongation factor Ts [Oscillospiraceae bacterium]|jgi:elongation factor Ts|nr:translation elongation factor Ts [Oscillospiraceae bacterium]
MAFTAQDVKNLREKTGCGMMECKNALVCSGGDFEAAIDFLRERGLAAASKKSGRVASEGMAFAKVSLLGNVGAIIEVNSETDFVACNKDFQNFVYTCADSVIESAPENIEALLKVKVDSKDTIGSILESKILTMGENIKIRRFERLEGLVSTYVHAGGKIAVAVQFSGDVSLSENIEFKNMARDVAMQIAAANPRYVSSGSVDSEILEHEKKILKEQAINSGKTGPIAEKIVSGKMGKFYKDVCLLEQPFVKDTSITVFDYIQGVAKRLGENLGVLKFFRFERGEGLEKREENFAEEVAKVRGKN